MSNPNETEGNRSPADRGRLLTEQRNPRSERLDEMSAREIVALINDEDAGVIGPSPLLLLN